MSLPVVAVHTWILRGGDEVPPPTYTLENCKSVGFPINTGPDPLENQKATKPAFSTGHNRPTNYDDPLLLILDPLSIKQS